MNYKLYFINKLYILFIMKLKKILEEIKSEKYVGIFICVFFIFIYYIYRKMSSCKKSIEYMTNLSDKQISEVINRFYTSTDFVRSITIALQKLEINGLLIEGDIIVNKNVNVDGEIRNNTISFTEIEKKIEMLEDTRIFRVTSTPFREITLNTGNPYVKDMIKDVWYWIFAAHNGSQFIWGFFLRKKDDRPLLYFYNNNIIFKYFSNTKLIPLDCFKTLIYDSEEYKYILPIDSNNFGIPYLIKIYSNKNKHFHHLSTVGFMIQPVNSLNLPDKSYFKKNFFDGNGLNDQGDTWRCTLNDEDIPSINVSFFEGWKNSKLPFKQMKNTNYDWRSAFDLYKNSTNVPSISIQ